MRNYREIQGNLTAQIRRVRNAEQGEQFESALQGLLKLIRGR